MVASSSSIRRCESVPSNSWIRRRSKRRYSRTSSGVRFRVSSFTMKYGAILYSTSPGPVLFTPGRERIPGRYTKEVLEDFATHADVVGDGLSGLARERRQFALQDVLRVGALFRTLEQWQIALQERLDAFTDLLHLFDREDRVAQYRLSFGVFQDGHLFSLSLFASSLSSILSCLASLENPYRLQ